MPFKFVLATLYLSLLFNPTGGAAHSGGLNAEGCHAGSRPYHCHRSQGVKINRVRAATGGFDKNCADFRTWRQAQRFFEAAGAGDPHGLDRDRDGIACEALR